VLFTNATDLKQLCQGLLGCVLQQTAVLQAAVPTVDLATSISAYKSMNFNGLYLGMEQARACQTDGMQRLREMWLPYIQRVNILWE